jgi:hypothetical protein
MKRIAFFVALFAGALLASQAHAQSRGTGAYLGAGVMQVYTDNATEFAYFAIPAGGSADSTATGFKIFGGYVWPARFGIEVGYYELGTFSAYTFGTKSDEFNTTALAFSGTFSLPINPSVDVLLKLGFAYTDVDYRCFSLCGGSFVNTSHTDIAGLMGIGLDWRIASNFSVRADWEYFGGVVHSVGGMIGEYGYSAVSIAGQFRF